jgi:AraC-like DNA-binding protein
MAKRYWEPGKSTVERAPNRLQVSHEQPGVMDRPHWHAQVEVNYIFRGAVHYRMPSYSLHLGEGSLALFWGGMPHQVVDTSNDPEFVAIHLPVVNFFRLRLPLEIQHRVIHGATLLSLGLDPGDFYAFNRLSTYLRSDDPARVEYGIDELLLRLERIPLDSYSLLDPTGARTGHVAEDNGLSQFNRVRQICDFIADNFRQDIDSFDIAVSADIHPKYAMSIFRKSTGMTLNEYLTLLRLSFAQAKLINDDDNVLAIAMESGFRSLSAFNKSFRKISGKSPSDFRRDYRPRRSLHH